MINDTIFINTRRNPTMSYGFDLLNEQTPPEYTSSWDASRYAPFSRITNIESSFSQYDLPFALALNTFHPGTDVPSLYTILCPDYAFYSMSTQEDLDQFKSSFVMHQHNTFELIYVIEGDFYQNIENTIHKYPAGSCCLLSPIVFHTEDYTHDCRLATLSCSEELLNTLFFQKSNQYFQVERSLEGNELRHFLKNHLSDNPSTGKNYIDFIPRKDPDWSIKHVHSIFDLMTQQILAPISGSSFHIQALICRLFDLLGNPENFDTTPVSLGTQAETALFTAISKRMEETHGRIGRNELIQEFNYSGTYINNVVKKFTGMNIFHYGNTFTMQEAARLLTATTLSVSEIALQLSFSDRTHFYRLFRETYGMTPKEYRENNIRS